MLSSNVITRLGMGSIFALTLVSAIFSTQISPITASIAPISVPPTSPTNNKPVFTTNSLATSVWKNYYFQPIEGYDLDLEDNVLLMAGGLPRGLTLDNCVSKTSIKTGRTDWACTLRGYPAETGNFNVTLVATDAQNNKTTVNMPLRVARFIYTNDSSSALKAN